MNNYLYITSLLFLAVFYTAAGYAQKELDWARKGNTAMEAGNYEDALRYYNNALNENPDHPEIKYNAATAKYRLEKFEEAEKEFQELSAAAENKDLKAKTFHNLGNSLMKQEKWEESAEAFKQALINNPSDEDSRYNLSYALRKLREQEQQDEDDDDDGEDEDQDDDGDEEEENQDGDEDEEGEDEEEEDGEGDDEKDDGDEEEDQDGSDRDDEQDKGDEEEQEQQRPDQISPQEAERILDAMLNEEKDVRDALQQKQKAGKGKEIEKEW